MSAIDRLRAENQRLRTALIECAAPWESRECTVPEALGLLMAEFERRADLAAIALKATSEPD